MSGKTEILVNQRTLDDAVKDGFAIIARSYADDNIKKSERKEAIKKAMATFLGIYKVVKNSFRDSGISSNISYYQREALLDCYSSYIAAQESIMRLASDGITKARDTKTLFNKDIIYYTSEREQALREKRFVGELLSCYYDASCDLSGGMMGDFTISYFEWIILQAIKGKDAIPQHNLFEETVSKYSVVLPSNGKAARRYEGFRVNEKMTHGKQSELKRCAERREEYRFLVRNLPRVTFADVGGLEEHKKVIYDAIKLPIEKRDRFIEMGVEATKGLIFYGEKGCGKTFIAKAIASEMKLPFFELSGPMLLNKYVGVGADIIRQLFEDAKNIAPSIIFIDEVDACLLNRDAFNGSYVREQVNQMLAEIDGFHPLGFVKVIVATNCYEALDGTFIDRFPPKYHLEFKLPDADMRLEALKAITRKQKINGVDLGSLAGGTNGANFRALFHICNEAGLYAIKDDAKLIEQRHFNLALTDYGHNPNKYGGIK